MKNKMILIIGGTGSLGDELTRRLINNNQVYRIKKPNIIANHILVRLDLFRNLENGEFINLNNLR